VYCCAGGVVGGVEEDAGGAEDGAAGAAGSVFVSVGV